MSEAQLPRVAITMGDPSGIGPEVVVKALADPRVRASCQPWVIGDLERLREAQRLTGTSVPLIAADHALHLAGAVGVEDLGNVPSDQRWGEISPAAGDAAYRYVERACQLALSGEADAICTAPLNKEAMNAAGHHYPGHTELLAKLCGIDEVSMMLSTNALTVIHVTTHVGLVDAIRRIDAGLVERTIERGRTAWISSHLTPPRIGVCAVNPHAGENGLFGQHEEEEKILPAIRRLRARGWDVDGPLPADTAFFLAMRGRYDLMVAMYHDQGHIPVKVLGLESGVNITVGLPVIRTSVDHGTAFDIAGTGVASEQSMVEAIVKAAEFATTRVHDSVPEGHPEERA